LGYDERPLRISQKLKEAKQNPVFVLKHVKDNKPFIPPNYSHPRPAPPKPHDKPQHTTKTNNNNISPNHNNTSITSGRVGFEVVIPVMSSSISSPTTKNAQQQPTASSSSTTKRNVQPQQTVYNNELGLDNAVVNAIFSINNSPQNP
jgi:hypothetical protein